MWMAWELEPLLVWADERQARGDLRGTYTACSVAASQLGEGVERRRLLEQLRRLEPQLELPGKMQAQLDQLPGIELEWEHGVVVGLRYFGSVSTPHGLQMSHANEALLFELLEQPLLRFVQELQLAHQYQYLDEQGRPLLDAQVRDPNLLSTLPRGIKPRQLPNFMELFASPARAALRPRVLRYGRTGELHIASWPKLGFLSLDIPDPKMERHTPSSELRALLAPERGLFTLTKGLQSAPLYAVGPPDNNGRRSKLEARLAKGKDDRLSMCLALRGLWDRASRVRELALEWLRGAGPVAAALALPDLMLQVGTHEPSVKLREQVVRELLDDPQVVAAVAAQLDPHQPKHIEWLDGCIMPEAKSVLPRLERALEQERKGPRRSQWHRERWSALAERLDGL